MPLALFVALALAGAPGDSAAPAPPEGPAAEPSDWTATATAPPDEPVAAPGSAPPLRFRLELLLGTTQYDGVGRVFYGGSEVQEDFNSFALGGGLFWRRGIVEVGMAASVSAQLFGPSLTQQSVLAGLSVPLGPGPEPRARFELLGVLGRTHLGDVGGSLLGSTSTSGTLTHVGARTGLSWRIGGGRHLVLGLGLTLTHDLGAEEKTTGSDGYRLGGELASGQLRLGYEG